MFLSFILFLEKNKISVFAATEIQGVGVGDVFKLNSVYKAWQYYSFSFYDNDGNYLSKISGAAYNESDDIFTIDNDFSDYWVVYDVFSPSSNILYVYLKPYTYIKPEFSLECSSNHLLFGETSLCSLNVRYSEKLNNINFSLNDDEFEISNLNVGDSFENLTLLDGVYNLNLKSGFEEVSNTNNASVVTFEILNNKRENLNLENIVLMYNLGYDDVVDSNSLDALFVTANQEMIVTPSDDTIFTPSDGVVISPSDDVNNPKTGDSSYFGIFLIILLGNVGLFLFIYKRQEIKL